MVQQPESEVLIVSFNQRNYSLKRMQFFSAFSSTMSVEKRNNKRIKCNDGYKHPLRRVCRFSRYHGRIHSQMLQRPLSLHEKSKYANATSAAPHLYVNSIGDATYPLFYATGRRHLPLIALRIGHKFFFSDTTTELSAFLISFVILLADVIPKYGQHCHFALSFPLDPVISSLLTFICSSYKLFVQVFTKFGHLFPLNVVSRGDYTSQGRV